RGRSENFAAGLDDSKSGESRAHNVDEQRNQRYPAEKIHRWRRENQYLQDSGEGGKQPLPLADAIHKLSLDDCRSARRGMIMWRAIPYARDMFVAVFKYK